MKHKNVIYNRPLSTRPCGNNDGKYLQEGLVLSRTDVIPYPDNNQDAFGAIVGTVCVYFIKFISLAYFDATASLPKPRPKRVIVSNALLKSLPLDSLAQVGFICCNH